MDQVVMIGPPATDSGAEKWARDADRDDAIHETT